MSFSQLKLDMRIETMCLSILTNALETQVAVLTLMNKLKESHNDN